MTDGFKITIKPVKVHKTVKQKTYTKISRKTVGKVEIEDDEFVVRVSVYEVQKNLEKSAFPPQLVLPLTDKSFKLKGREKVFSHTKG